MRKTLRFRSTLKMKRSALKACIRSTRCSSANEPSPLSAGVVPYSPYANAHIHQFEQYFQEIFYDFTIFVWKNTPGN